MSKLGTYYLGALIVDHQALDRINAFRKTLLGCSQDAEEAHLTILPPFRTSYENASAINVGCGMVSLMSMHPMHTTLFEMRGLEIIDFGGEDFIVCPVTPHAPPGQETWEQYVPRIRQKLTDLGISYKEQIPSEYRPHVTVCRKKEVSARFSLKKAIAESETAHPLYFRVTYLVLHAKYKDGYSMISIDPARE